ncbi:MAG: zinc-ribbon domain containing protein [Candidatus Eremiobacteraeota bacterium]|nr:zinc-ribbon domain containing protein [Candidatus Eremiobacteraeota bacterium]
MILTDKTMACRECEQEFVFTVGEQEFYQEKGFTNEPKLCPDCRRARKRNKRDGSRKLYTVTCAECNCETQVPFEPTSGKPVYCRDCFESRRNMG